MQQQKFDNMIQVLTYFADQCDMFKPMLEGVNTLKDENTLLKEKLKTTNIINNRLQLNSTFSADYANFGIATVKNVNEEDENLKISNEKDLYNLIEAVIKVGKDNYIRTDMEYKLSFYNMIEKISDENYLKLNNMIKKQNEEQSVLPIDKKEDKESVIKDNKEQSTDTISK